MKPQTKETIKNFIKETKEILDELDEQVNPGKKHNHWTGLELHFDWQMSLDFAKCADSAWKRFFCRLAHGEECGHKDFLVIKKAGKKAFNKIKRSFYGKGLGSEVSYSSFDFTIDRHGMRIIVYITPDSTVPGCGP